MNELAKHDAASDSVARVRKDLDDSRKRLASTADALRGDLREGISDLREGATRLKQNLNWKTWVRKDPWVFVAGAVVIGIIMGSRSR